MACVQWELSHTACPLDTAAWIRVHTGRRHGGVPLEAHKRLITADAAIWETIQWGTVLCKNLLTNELWEKSSEIHRRMEQRLWSRDVAREGEKNKEATGFLSKIRSSIMGNMAVLPAGISGSPRCSSQILLWLKSAYVSISWIQTKTNKQTKTTMGRFMISTKSQSLDGSILQGILRITSLHSSFPHHRN